MHVYRQFIYFLNIAIIVGWDSISAEATYDAAVFATIATVGVCGERQWFAVNLQQSKSLLRP